MENISNTGLDEIDLRILRRLQTDTRVSNVDLAAAVGLALAYQP